MLIKIIISALVSVSLWEGIYDYSVPKIEGGDQALSAYSGKKIMVVNLPLTRDAAADSLLYALDTIATAHATDLAVIAVPSVEDGFTSSQKDSLQSWYRSKLGNHVLITDGLYTRKISGYQQHGLFKWLTDVNRNTAFNMEITDPGYKFFVHADGTLYAVLRPHTKMWSNAVNKVLNTEPPTE